MEPFASMLRPAGNDFDVNLLPDYKILHDAGYNVLAYDFRNHGQSGRANGIVYTASRFESRDVIGSLKYIRSHPDIRNMTLSLFPPQLSTINSCQSLASGLAWLGRCEA